MTLGRENETLEFKKSTGELKEAIISIVAMLNKNKSGQLFFGVRNDGTPVGQDVSDKTFRDISQAIANHIQPEIYPNINAVVINNATCIQIEFSGSVVPYYAYGRAYLRVADEDRVMAPHDLENYIIKKNSTHRVWDSELSDKTFDDIDEQLLINYMERANSAGRVDFLYTNKKEVLNKLNLIKDDKIHNTAEIMFCKNSGVEIQMAIFATNERLTFNDIKRESGTIPELVDIAEKYIKNNIHWNVRFDGSIQRKETPEIPLDAIREALVNSFCHRDYQISQNNEVTIFNDRIEIYNPGTFPEGLTPEDFIEGSERSIKRNPQLAQLLYYSKDVESFGTGLRRIKKACSEANVKIEFNMLKTGFAVVFYRTKNEVTDKMTDKMTDKSTQRQQMILEYITLNDSITNKTTCELLQVSDTTAKRILKSMVDSNIIDAVGEKKARYYVLK